MTGTIINTFVKPPAEVKDFLMDWSDKLDTGDTISTSAWSILPLTSPPLVEDSETETDDSATIWVSGGAVGSLYTLENTITTAGGRKFVEAIQVRCSHLQLGVSSLAELAEVDAYLAAVENSTWLALNAGAREAYILRASRLLDRQRWLGSRTSSDQPLAWPRSGITLDGASVGDDEYPQRLLDAVAEVAAALAAGSDVESVFNQAQKVQSIKAGSVAISYFRGAEGPSVRFPPTVHELLHDLLAGGTLSVQGVATGVSGESSTGEDLGFSESP